MTERPAEPDLYQGERLREALAHDPRVGELGIEVAICDETVVLSGTMATPEQQEAAVAIARDFLPAHRVRVETRTPDLTEPTDSEHLP